MRCSTPSAFVSASDILSKKRWLSNDPMTAWIPCSGIRQGTGSVLSSSAVVTLSCSVNWCTTEPRLARSSIVIRPVYAPLSRYTGRSCNTMDNRDNQQFSAMFQDIASVLELQGDDPFRIRAYRRAAQTLASLSEPVRNIARRGVLE